MCRPVRCRTCGKTTWAGCGQHVDQVRAATARADWCPGHEATSTAADQPGLLRRLFRRG
jgi:hypothetical protein